MDMQKLRKFVWDAYITQFVKFKPVIVLCNTPQLFSQRKAHRLRQLANSLFCKLFVSGNMLLVCQVVIVDVLLKLGCPSKQVWFWSVKNSFSVWFPDVLLKVIQRVFTLAKMVNNEVVLLALCKVPFFFSVKFYLGSLHERLIICLRCGLIEPWSLSLQVRLKTRWLT